MIAEANTGRRFSWLRSAVAMVLLGCAPRVPLPPETSHEGDTPVVVPYPPPPAQVEMVGPPPDETAVWLDGSWRWTGAAYVWTEGGWERPPPGARYAPPIAVRRSNGELVYFPGTWHGPAPTPFTGSGSPSPEPSASPRVEGTAAP